MEINCYRCEELIYKPIALLCTKILDEKSRAIILIDILDEKRAMEQNKEIDDGLWTFSKIKFLPHSSVFDKEFQPQRQPIFISNKEENLNNSDYLIITANFSSDFAKGFRKICYFYRPQLDNSHLKIINQLKTITSNINHFEQNNGKWQKIQQ